MTAVRYSKGGGIEHGVFDCREGNEGLLCIFSTTPLGDDASFEGTTLAPIGSSWWAGR